MAQAADGNIVIQVLLDDKDVEKGIKDVDKKFDGLDTNASNKLSKIGNGFKTMAKTAAIGAAAIAGVGAAAIGLAKPLVEAAGAAQAVNAQFEQVFGDLESAATNALNKISDETSILPERLKYTFTQMAAFAKTAGADTEQALNLTERATLAAADSAAFYDRSIEDVAESLQSFLKGKVVAPL